MLDDIVTQLNTLEKNLPKAAEEFKKQYPNGEFTINISISITSDKTAKNPVIKGNVKPDDGKTPEAPKPDAPKPDAPKVAPKKPDAAPTP